MFSSISSKSTDSSKTQAIQTNTLSLKLPSLLSALALSALSANADSTTNSNSAQPTLPNPGTLSSQVGIKYQQPKLTGQTTTPTSFKLEFAGVSNTKQTSDTSKNKGSTQATASAITEPTPQPCLVPDIDLGSLHMGVVGVGHNSLRQLFTQPLEHKTVSGWDDPNNQAGKFEGLQLIKFTK